MKRTSQAHSLVMFLGLALGGIALYFVYSYDRRRSAAVNS